MKLYARFLKWRNNYAWHNAALREINLGIIEENRFLRQELKREENKVEYLLVHRLLLTEEVRELVGRKCKCS